MVCIRPVAIGIPSRIQLVLVNLVFIELVLVLLVSTDVVVWIVLVKLVSGILEWVLLVYYIYRFALILRFVCPQFMETITSVKLTRIIERTIVGSIMIPPTICITTMKSNWVRLK